EVVIQGRSLPCFVASCLALAQRRVCGRALPDRSRAVPYRRATSSSPPSAPTHGLVAGVLERAARRVVEERRHRAAVVERHEFARLVRDGLGVEAEGVLELRDRRRRAKAVEPELRVRVVAPAERRRGLDREHGDALTEHLLLVRERLLVKEVAAGHRHDARLERQQLGGLDRKRHLRAGREEHDVRRAVERRDLGAVVQVLEHVAAERDLVRGRAREVRQSLAAEREHRRLGRVLNRRDVRADRLVAVRGAVHVHVGHRAQRRVHLDRLVRRAVLAQKDAVVRRDVDDAEARERAHAHRAERVADKVVERRAERAQRAVRKEPVRDRGHRVLAHAKADVAPDRRVLLEVARHRELRQVRRRQVRRAAHDLRERGCGRVQRDLRELARRERLVLRRVHGEVFLPVRRQLAGEAALVLGRKLWVRGLVRRERRVPLALELRAARGLVIIRLHLLRHVEHLVALEPKLLLRGREVVGLERRAVH
ncbi:hypothetical protein PybrP1_007706, partial [[Pythium] brassicae (nom. inval.)]